MNRKELIKKYIEFFEKHDHARIKNSSLVPENDPTVLFTTAGMHPLVPYLLGEKHPQGDRVCNVQRCIRTVDIEEVGDTTHHTFFEMLGNWSIGDYFKKEAIEMSYEFLTEVLGLPKERLAFTVFEGNDNAPKDEEAAGIWMKQGVAKERIAYLPAEDNWWGPAGQTGPCGPCTEMFYWKPNDIAAPEVFDPEDDNWVEIWNDVLMEYNKDSDGNYNKAAQQNVDTGMGTERTVAVLNGLEDNYLADMWWPIIEKIEELSSKEYKGNEREMRIIADHVKASVFIIADGITPGNADQAYVLRRLIRRAVMNLRKLGFVGTDLIRPIAEVVFDIYDEYSILQDNREKILKEFDMEEERFEKTLEQGLKVFEKVSKEKINGKNAFLLYQSYGFPIEMTLEMAEEKGIEVDEDGFREELKKHQELSRTASAGKFKSGLADNSEATTRLHTACHLLNEALREVLGSKDIYQRGSNITPDRLRFDFNFDRKLTDEEKKAVEDLVNEKISEGLEVTMEEMSVDEARAQGAVGVFDDKYGEKVKVYSVGDFSKELCAGPHVENTSELGHFKIKKEQSSSAGVRRIKAVLE
jgi:alanyl-tRNA synthetase